MGEGGKAEDIGGQGLGKGVSFKLAGNRLAGWKPFKHPLPPPDRYKKLNSVNPCLVDTITYLPISVQTKSFLL